MLNELTKLQVLHFLVQNIHVCLNIKNLNKVLSLPMIDPIPGRADYWVGVMNFAGSSIPVIDLAVRLGMHRDEYYSVDTPVLLCSDGVQQLGLIVDKILGLVEVAPTALQLHNEFDNPNSPFIGVVSLEKELSLLINFNKLLEPENTLVVPAKLMELKGSCNERRD